MGEYSLGRLLQRRLSLEARRTRPFGERDALVTDERDPRPTLRNKTSFHRSRQRKVLSDTDLVLDASLHLQGAPNPRPVYSWKLTEVQRCRA